MKRRLTILTEIIAPYRIPLFNALDRNPNLDLHVIFLAETDPSLRQWLTYKGEIKFSYQVLSSWRKRLGKYNILLNAGAVSALAQSAPHIVLCGGYSYAASWQVLFWARRHKIPFFLWSESNAHDLRGGHTLVEFLKAEFIHRCTGFVVPGRSAREYLRSHNVNDQNIFTAPNAVDNEFFASAAQRARQDACALKQELALPQRYFLFVGRLVREKGIFELLAAYAKLEQYLREQVGLVFVGDGPSRRLLEQQAASVSPARVRFAGFAQREQLAIYYGLAEALVLPTYTDPWGLVVNEAMSCGLPLILSRVAGSAADLVKEDWNGLLVEPKDVTSLTSAMRNLACRPAAAATMGARSAQHISLYTPEAWSDGIGRMIEATRASW